MIKFLKKAAGAVKSAWVKTKEVFNKLWNGSELFRELVGTAAAATVVIGVGLLVVCAIGSAASSAPDLTASTYTPWSEVEELDYAKDMLKYAHEEVDFWKEEVDACQQTVWDNQTADAVDYIRTNNLV